MKPIVLLSFMILLLFSYSSRKDRKLISAFTCEEGTKDAILDAQKGEYLLMSFGLTVSISSPGYSNKGYYSFRNKFIFEKYGIIYESGGCVSTQYDKCYREKTEELLFDRYGNDILNNAEKEAIELFKETKEYKENIRPIIESNNVFPSFIVHDNPAFIEGKKKMEEYLGRSTNIYGFGLYKEHIEVHFIVEKDGKISNVEVTSSDTKKKLESSLQKEIINLMEKMPAWKPGVYFNEKVRVAESINLAI